MIRKLLLTSMAGCMLTVGAMGAEIFVRVAPPRPVVERRVVSPGRGYVYVRGYHRWDGGAYVWVPGEWQRPPRERARWVDHRWQRRNGGYVFVEGHWR